MIRVCTDSNAQLPPELQQRYGIAIVPLSVTVDGVDHREHVDIDADAFYRAFEGGRRPEVTTAAPSPDRFLAAWESLAAAGADEIVSVHIGSDVSGTLNAARLAAPTSPVPVRLVDTGSASFAVAAAAWAAAERAAASAPLAEVAAAAEETAARCDNTFVVGTLDLARAGGRLADAAGQPVGIPVLRLVRGRMEVVGSAATAEEAAGVMAGAVVAGGQRVRAGVGWSDRSSRAVADELVARLETAPTVDEVVRYRIGPSVGAHTGPGTAGAVFWTVA